jgi:hypothetical protein
LCQMRFELTFGIPPLPQQTLHPATHFHLAIRKNLEYWRGF